MVLGRVSVELEEDPLKLTLDADDRVEDVPPVARLDRVRIFVAIVREPVVAAVNDFPRCEARDDHEPADLADDSIENARETVMRRVVDVDAAQDLRMADEWQEEEKTKVPRRRERVKARDVHFEQQGPAKDGVKEIVPNVKESISL
jgi:hypothetical protein